MNNDIVVCLRYYFINILEVIRIDFNEIKRHTCTEFV